jgi:hypothetical protein
VIASLESKLRNTGCWPARGPEVQVQPCGFCSRLRGPQPAPTATFLVESHLTQIANASKSWQTRFPVNKQARIAPRLRSRKSSPRPHVPWGDINRYYFFEGHGTRQGSLQAGSVFEGPGPESCSRISEGPCLKLGTTFLPRPGWAGDPRGGGAFVCAGPGFFAREPPGGRSGSATTNLGTTF